MENKLNAGNQGLTSPKVSKNLTLCDNPSTFASPKFARKRNGDIQPVNGRKISDNKTEMGQKLCYISPKKNILQCMNGGCSSTASLASLPVGRSNQHKGNHIETSTQNLNKNFKETKQIVPHHQRHGTENLGLHHGSQENVHPFQQAQQIQGKRTMLYQSPPPSSHFTSDQGNSYNMENIRYSINSKKRPQRRSMKISRQQIYPSKMGNNAIINGAYYGQDQISDFSDGLTGCENDLEDIKDKISQTKTTKSKYLRQNFYPSTKYTSPNLKKESVKNYNSPTGYQKGSKNSSSLAQMKEYFSTTNLHQHCNYNEFSSHQQKEPNSAVMASIRQLNCQKNISDVKSLNNVNQKKIMSKKVIEDDKFYMVEKVIPEKELLNEANKQNEELKAKIEDLQKNCKQIEEKSSMLKEENNYMYRKIEEYSVKMMEKDNQIRNYQGVLFSKQDEIISMKIQAQSLQQATINLNAKIEQINTEKEALLEKDKENIIKINALMGKLTKYEQSFYQKSCNSPRNYPQMNYSSIFMTDQTTIEYRQEDDFCEGDEKQQSSQTPLFLDLAHHGGHLNPQKLKNLQKFEKLEEQLKKCQQYIREQSKVKQLQEFIIQKLRHDLKTEIEKYQRTKISNKRLLFKVESLTIAQKKNTQSLKNAKASNKNCNCNKKENQSQQNRLLQSSLKFLQNQELKTNRISRFDAAMRKDISPGRRQKQTEQNTLEDEFSFQLSPEKCEPVKN